MFLLLKNSCFRADDIIACTCTSTYVENPEPSENEPDVVVCNVLNVFLRGVVSPITIYYDNEKERDEAYTSALECLGADHKGV